MISDDIYSFTKKTTKREAKVVTKKNIHFNNKKNNVSRDVFKDATIPSKYIISNNFRLKKDLFDTENKKSKIEAIPERQYVNNSQKIDEIFNNTNTTLEDILPTSTMLPNLTNYQNDLIFGRFNLWFLIVFILFYSILIVASIIICRIDLKVRNTTVACRKKSLICDSELNNNHSIAPPSLTPPKYHDKNDTNNEK
uniref:SLC3A2_N domain-containing protein n=1 Tax=Strongyloides stercoralis TaxID=6248 RepID=A0A0K0DWJ2_STRER